MTDRSVFPSVAEADPTASYARVLPYALALTPEALVLVNLDVAEAVILAIRAVKRIPSYWDDLIRLHRFPVEEALRFPDYIWALMAAQSTYRMAIQPPPEMPQLLKEASRLREVLIADANTMKLMGHLNRAPMTGFKRPRGYKNVASDLYGLTCMYESAWGILEGKSAIRSSDLAEARALSMRLVEALAFREKRTKRTAVATDMRNRMFTLFLNTYNEIRRGILYLRRQDKDVESLFPCLYTRRPPSKSARKTAVTSKGSEPTQITALSPASPVVPFLEAPAGNAGSAFSRTLLLGAPQPDSPTWDE